MSNQSLPSPAGVKPVPIVTTNDYSEGAVIDRSGNLYFSHGDQISRVAPNGDRSGWAYGGAPNGHKILPNGEHLVCDGERQAVVRYSAEGDYLGPATGKRAGGLEIRCPNDLSLDREGGFYFSDSVAKTGAVHYVRLDGTMRLVAGDIDFANGVALSPDGTRLFVAESLRNRILLIRLKGPGVANGKPELFAELPRNQASPGAEFNQPDGIAFDREGRLWVAHYGMKAIHVLGTSGELLATYDGGNRLTSNLCFAGPGLASLYTTGGEPGAIFRLDVNVPGLPLLPGL